MPLIHYQYGMYVLYASILILVFIIVIAFKRKKWL